MDGNRFDELTRGLADGRTRRAVLKAMAGGVVAGIASVFNSGDPVAAASCRKATEICRKNGDCCSNKCGPPDFTGRSRCVCVTGTDCPRPSNGCKAATCINGVCGQTDACTGGQICFQNGCCTPASPEVTCLNQCGNVINNCGQTVACDPCCTANDGNCSTNAECCGVCIDGTCTDAAGPGEICDATDDCQSGLTCCDGVCNECCQSNDCTIHPNDCGSVSCDTGVCVTTYETDGTPTFVQTDGDCKKDVCNGAGLIVSISDDTDVFDDGNDCTANICTGGVVSNPALDAGVICAQNGGVVCDGAGNCVDCLIPSDCGTDTICRTWSCVQGACEFADALVGTFVSNEALGDCEQNECDGAGNIVTVAAPDDVPLGGQCNVNTCNGQTPSVVPEPEGTPCSFGFCDGDGECVQCLVDEDCADLCIFNVCSPCRGNGEFCQEATDCCNGGCGNGFCFTP